MGNVFKKIRTTLAGMSSSQSRIVMVGLDNSGKTTILYRIKLNEKVDTVPTIGFNVETVTLVKNVSFLVWDVTGQEKARPLWRHYTSGADGIMFVVDSCDRLRFDETKRELTFLLYKCVVILDKDVELKLVARANSAAEVWVLPLRSRETDEDRQEGVQNLDKPDLPLFQLELYMAQHKIQCKPPVLSCKSYLMNSFNDWIAIITSLPRLRSSRFEVEPGNLRDPSLDLPITKTYSSISTELMNVSPSPMLRGYRAIHQVVTAVELHVDQWTQYQCLWDMEFRHIYPRVKQDMALWQQLLREIEEAKAKIDSTSPHTLFGPIMVCSSVQAEVSGKHDMWHKKILTLFGVMLNVLN